MKNYRWIAMLSFVLLSFVATDAFAQNSCTGSECDEAAAIGSLYTSTTTGGGITTTAAVAGGIYLTLSSNDKGGAMNTYLKKNSVAVQSDLALGAGVTVDDLAAAYRVRPENRAAFGRILRENQAVLLSLANPENLSNLRAQSFTRAVYILGRAGGVIDEEYIEG